MGTGLLDQGRGGGPVAGQEGGEVVLQQGGVKGVPHTGPGHGPPHRGAPQVDEVIGEVKQVVLEGIWEWWVLRKNPMGMGKIGKIVWNWEKSYGNGKNRMGMGKIVWEWEKSYGNGKNRKGMGKIVWEWEKSYGNGKNRMGMGKMGKIVWEWEKWEKNGMGKIVWQCAGRMGQLGHFTLRAKQSGVSDVKCPLIFLCRIALPYTLQAMQSEWSEANHSLNWIVFIIARYNPNWWSYHWIFLSKLL